MGTGPAKRKNGESGNGGKPLGVPVSVVASVGGGILCTQGRDLAVLLSQKSGMPLYTGSK